MVTIFNEFKSSIPEIIEEARNGHMFVLVDDEDRENEGDIIVRRRWRHRKSSTSWQPGAAG